MDLAGTFTGLTPTRLTEAWMRQRFFTPEHPSADGWNGANLGLAFHLQDVYDVTANEASTVDVASRVPDMTNGLTPAQIAALPDKGYLMRDDEMLSLLAAADYSLATSLLATAYVALRPEQQAFGDGQILFVPGLTGTS